MEKPGHFSTEINSDGRMAERRERRLIFGRCGLSRASFWTTWQRPCLDPQTLQSGAPPHQPSRVQAKSYRCSGRVASTRLCLSAGGQAQLMPARVPLTAPPIVWIGGGFNADRREVPTLNTLRSKANGLRSQGPVPSRTTLDGVPVEPVPPRRSCASANADGNRSWMW